jgi:hypothetical protein
MNRPSERGCGSLLHVLDQRRAPLIGKKDRWAYTLSQARNELTHIGPGSREFPGEDLLFLTESVYAVVRICMLMECGVSHETLRNKANSSSMTWYRDRLKGSIERVRNQLSGENDPGD